MASGDISFRMGGDASGFLAATDRARRGQQGVNRELDLGAKVSASTANRIIRDVETQLERFKRLRSEIFRGWQQGKIKTEQYGRAIRALEKDYSAQEGAFKKFADTSKQELEQMEESADSVGDAFGRWGPRLLAAVAFVSQVRQGYQEVDGLINSTGENVANNRRGVGALRQLANNQQEFDDLQNAARRFYLSGAADSLGEGADAVFSLESANLLTPEAEALFLQLGARQVVPDLGKFARAIRTQLAAFGRGETGGATQIASKAFAASAFSPASVEDLLEAAALPGGVARFQGISDEEVLTATSLLATATGSANIGATALRSFLFSTGELEEFQGLTIKERVQKLQAKQLNTPQLKELLGRKEAIRGFTDLEGQLGKFDTVLGAVNRANFDRSAIDRKLSFADPLGEAARLKLASEAQAEFELETVAARRLITDAALRRDKAATASDVGPGVAAVGSALANTLVGAARLGAGQGGVEMLLEGTTTETEQEAIAALKRMPDLIEKQTQIMEKLLGQQVGELKETNAELKKQEGGLTVTNEQP